MTDLNEHQQQAPRLRPTQKNAPSGRIYEEAHDSHAHSDTLDQVISDLKQQKPSTKSILKRYDSSEKMNPISRPTSISHAQFNDISFSANGGTFPRNLHQNQNHNHNHHHSNHHHQSRGKLNSTTHSSHGDHLTSASAAYFSNQPPPQRKRVQFANMPPLTSAASVGDLSSNTRANRFTSEPQFRRDTSRSASGSSNRDG